jgi:hypothetical protein
MGFNVISCRANLQEISAIRRDCAELGVNRSELMRAALGQLLLVLCNEGLVSVAPPIRH